jgi:hypothetical protein
MEERMTGIAGEEGQASGMAAGGAPSKCRGGEVRCCCCVEEFVILHT